MTGALGAACSSSVDDGESGAGAITSNDGGIFDLKFEGKVLAGKDDPARQSVVAQLQYMQGMLTTEHNANAQVGLVTLTNVVESVDGDVKTITYAATLPVLWPKGKEVPKTYELPFPADSTKLQAFNAKYDGTCGKNEYGVETFWHDFNPVATGCHLADGDVTVSHATVHADPKMTQDKYPEYDKIWADDALDVVGVFGIISGNATPDDEGAREMENVLTQTANALTNANRTDGSKTSSILKDSSVTGEISVGGKTRKVNVTALLVEAVSDVGTDFDDRYGPLSEKADLIIYSGHSGLGKNINALAAKTLATKDKYQLMYLNGCQSFAYLGTALYDRRTQLNGQDVDPNGTKFLDIIANALPAYGDNGATPLTLYKAILASDSAPRSYNDLLKDFSPIHLVGVFGEDDNDFKP
jgi:hypothetical protein